MRVLVTGGTGFLGQAVVRALLARGDQVRVLGRNPAVCKTLTAEGAEVVQADLRDWEQVEAACAGMEVVCHAGALSAPWGRWADFEAINVGGTAHVIAGCQAHTVRRLVYISSPSVVFDGRDQRNATEDVPYPPRFVSPYAATKQRAETLVLAAGQGSLQTVTLRPKALFGPGDTTLLPRLLAAARAGRLFQIGNGRNLVDLTYIDNAVAATLGAIDADASATGKVYTITNGESVPLWQVVQQLLSHHNLPTALRRLPVPAALGVARVLEWVATLTGQEPLLTRYTVLILARTQTYNIRAAREGLSYAPTVSVKEGIARTLAAMG